MDNHDPFTWSPDQIKPILNLQTLETALKDNDIDGENLLALEDANVKEDLGISSFGQRREIRKIIHHLRSISSLYQATATKPQKRRLSSEDEAPETTPESKKRRIQSQDLLPLPLPSLYTPAASSDNHDLLPNGSSGPSAQPTEVPQKRRIQPQNLSTEPLTRSVDPSSTQAQFGGPIIFHNAGTDLDQFDPANLSDEWQDFLERYREDPDEPVLRPYNETDSEKELDSDDDASLLAELDSEDLPPPARISAEEIQSAVDETLEGYKKAWVIHKQSKKHKVAYRRWMQAATARTRRPQQNALQRELEVLQDRLAKFRQSITDSSMDYHKIGEVKRNCLNLQATIEDITEKEYYLEVLTSDHPPPRPEPGTQPPAPPEEKLSAGEELLDSSDDAEEQDNEQPDSVSDMSLASDGESGLSLPYDPADIDWNPRLPISEPAEHTHPLTQTQAINGTEATMNAQVEVTDLTQPEVMARSTPEAPQLPASELSKRDDMSSESEEEGSDLDRLPRNRYRDIGYTKDTAISLGSSPIRSSDDQTTLTDNSTNSIRTPPLNPTPSANIKRERTTTMKFPPIQELRAKHWRDVKGNPDLILCKVVYRTDRALVRSVLQFVDPLTALAVPDRLFAGLSLIQDMSDEGIENNDVRPDPLIAWTFFFLAYAHEKGFSDVWQVPEQRLDEAYVMIKTKAPPFDKLLRPLMRYYTETETSGVPQASLSKNNNNLSANNGNRIGRQNATYLRSTTPPPRNIYTDTETEIDEEPSSLKKRKRHVAQSQEALSQQREDQYRVQEQERRRQMMMDRLQSKEAVGEDRNVIVNSVEDVPIFLDQHIARRIKPHQESGVQFIWRELIEDKKHQGCLLAHTMGLGKTMQVISFLVTLAQCNASERPEVRALIPKRLRSGRILILCPASLVDNWYDELMIWTPDLPGGRGLLGTVYKISGSRNIKIKTIKDWQKRTPGVLIIGYESLRSLLTGKSVSDDDKKYLENALLKDPCVVVGDEAHKMKNAKSAISKLAQTFTTTSRIALTGSPLNNHLEEYHTMIDWIAPGYLGNLVQFKTKYSEPIERGLFAESTRYEKRKSLERLYVLKRDLAPKIDRRDISAIASDMPQKTEFFITVPLTELQKGMYSLLIKHVLSGLSSSGAGSKKSSNAQLWSWLSILSWLCNHPTILTQKLQNQDKSNIQMGVDNEDDDDDGAPANVDVDKYPIAALLPEFLQQYARFEEAADMYNPELSTRALVTQRLIEESVNKGERILLFSHSIPTLNYLQGLLDKLQYKYMRIDGSTRTDQRQAATKEFNDDNNDYSVFLISTRAGGLGLNLQGANRVIIYDFGFNPSWEEQAIGRAYRLGQKKPVFVYRFRAGGSFEDAMYNKSIFKTQLFSRVVDQKNVIRHTSRDIKDYLFEPKEVEQKDLSECLGKDELLDRVVEMVPGAIRDLILTETFQREDEDDELTAEEKKIADEAVEMERLQRANPAEFAIKQAEKQRAQRTVAMQQAMTQSAFTAPTQVRGEDIHNLFKNAVVLVGDDKVVRDSAKANMEKMGVPEEKVVEAMTPSSGDGSDEQQSRPPGCEPQ